MPPFLTLPFSKKEQNKTTFTSKESEMRPDSFDHFCRSWQGVDPVGNMKARGIHPSTSHFQK